MLPLGARTKGTANDEWRMTSGATPEAALALEHIQRFVTAGE